MRLALHTGASIWKYRKSGDLTVITPDRGVHVGVTANSMRCFSMQDTLLSHCLSRARCINEYRRI